jgi:hypothetical protein
MAGVLRGRLRNNGRSPRWRGCGWSSWYGVLSSATSDPQIAQGNAADTADLALASRYLWRMRELVNAYASPEQWASWARVGRARGSGGASPVCTPPAPCRARLFLTRYAASSLVPLPFLYRWSKYGRGESVLDKEVLQRLWLLEHGHARLFWVLHVRVSCSPVHLLYVISLPSPSCLCVPDVPLSLPLSRSSSVAKDCPDPPAPTPASSGAECDVSMYVSRRPVASFLALFLTPSCRIDRPAGMKDVSMPLKCQKVGSSAISLSLSPSSPSLISPCRGLLSLSSVSVSTLSASSLSLPRFLISLSLSLSCFSVSACSSYPLGSQHIPWPLTSLPIATPNQFQGRQWARR